MIFGRLCLQQSDLPALIFLSSHLRSSEGGWARRFYWQTICLSLVFGGMLLRAPSFPSQLLTIPKRHAKDQRQTVGQRGCCYNVQSVANMCLAFAARDPTFAPKTIKAESKEKLTSNFRGLPGSDSKPTQNCQGKEKHININKFAGFGGWQNFVDVFFSGHSLWGRKNT